MPKETILGVYQSDLLSRYGVVHGFSSRALGDMRDVEPRKRLKQVLGISSYRLIGAEQVHGSTVHVVTSDDFSKTVAGVDALVFKLDGSKVALGIIVADCIPLLFADLQARVIGVAHAGWRGTLTSITTNTVSEMEKLGSRATDILVSMGPHIGMCHYNVLEERAQKFLNNFDNDPKVASYFEGAWHVDIGWANYRQLLDAGVLKEHIDGPPTCTFCQNDTFFSFRKEKSALAGEIMGVIALS